MIPSRAALAARFVGIAQEYVGISRETDREQIGKFLALFGLPFAEEDGTPVAFCASGLAWCACKAWCELAGIAFTAESAVEVFRGVLADVGVHFYVPNPSCSAMVEAAQRQGFWVGVDDVGADEAILPGWVVIYQFSATDRHTEVIRADNGDELETVGFNTTDGCHTGVVADKSRSWSCILGFIRTWEENPNNNAAPGVS